MSAEPEIESLTLVVQPLDEQLQIALTRGHSHDPRFAAPMRSFADDRCARAADGDTRLPPLARSLPEPEIELRAGAVAVALRVAAVQQRHVLENVAVDHRDRPRRGPVFDGADGVQQKRRGEAVDRHVHMGEIAAAHAELAAEIVAGRDPRQHLDGAQRVVGQHAAQILDVGAAEHLLRRDAGFGRDGTGPPPR